MRAPQTSQGAPGAGCCGAGGGGAVMELLAHDARRGAQRVPPAALFVVPLAAPCRHRGRRLCLGEPPWQPKTANAAVAARGRAAALRGLGVARSSARTPERAPRSALGSAAVAGGALHSSSTSSREHASWEAVRRAVPAVRARACRLSDEAPLGGTGASLLLSCADFGVQQCQLGFICLGWSPVIYRFQAVLLWLVHLTLQRTQSRGRWPRRQT